MDQSKRKLKENPRVKANLLSKLSFWWVVPLIWSRQKKVFGVEDLHKPEEVNETEVLALRMEKYWAEERARARCKGAPPSYVRALFCCFGWRILGMGVVSVVEDCVVRIGQSIMLGYLIRCAPAAPEEGGSSVVWMLAAGVVLGSVFHAFAIHQLYMRGCRIGMQLRVASCALLYRKFIRLSNSALGKTTVGQMINLLSNDVGRFDTCVVFFNFLWVGPLQLLIVTLLLWYMFGPTCIAGILLLILYAPLQSIMSRIFSRLRIATALLTDERMKVMNEILNAIRVIKMYAWEILFSNIVSDARKKEIDVIMCTNWFRALNASLFFTSSKMVLLFLLLAYVLTGHVLTAEIVFVTFSVIESSTILMTLYFPTAINMGSEALVSCSRLQEFLLLEEVEESSRVKAIEIIRPDERAGISMNSISATWDGATAVRGVSASVKAGQLLAVIGPVGSGKSSLLQAILRELPLAAGNITIKGKKAYCSQEAWLFSGSIRQNILFGSKYNEEKYKQVVRVCQLEEDLNHLPNGDLSRVGEKGIRLSGGQKARINLARAVYVDADVLLLDDPLGAVDTAVGRLLFTHCIKTHLKNKACILVTHQLQYLKEADSILVLNGEGVRPLVVFQQLVSCGINFSSLVKEEEECSSSTVSLKHSVHFPESLICEANSASSQQQVTKSHLDVSSDNGAASPDNGTTYPINGTASPDNGTTCPINGTASPDNGTTCPINGTASPDNGTTCPINGTASPDNGTTCPINGTASPDNGTTCPINGTASPDNGTTCPINGTASPDNGTTCPINGTASPDNGTTYPINGTASPDNGTTCPINGTASPDNGTTYPINGAASPDDTTASLDYGTFSLDKGTSSFDKSTPLNKATPSLDDDTPAELRSEGDVSTIVYLKYFLNGGHWLVLVSLLVVNVVTQVVLSASDWWLAVWTNEVQLLSLINTTTNRNDTFNRESATSDYVRTDTNIIIYSTLLVGLFFFSFARTILFFMVCMTSSKNLHDKMFGAVIRVPIQFFDTHPIGQILNRFGNDMGQIDEMLPADFFDFIHIMIYCLANVVLISYMLPWLLVPTFVLVLASIFFRRLYLRPSRDIKRLEAITRSPVFSHLSTTFNGLRTIRAFRAEKAFIQDFDSYQNTHTSAWFLFLSISCWFRFCLDWLSTIYMAVVTFSFIATNEKGGDLGLAINLAMMLSGMFQFGMRKSTDVENQMTSVERVLEYCKLEPEAPLETEEDRKVKPSWPESGSVTFTDVSLRYNKYASPILKNLSFSISSGEKIGIVGRTGAGKSSLLSCFFRLTEPEGQIFIDGQEIGPLGLHKLRANISIIPQDPTLFNTSFRRNLDPFSRYTDEQIWHALEEVQLKETVEHFPLRLGHVVSEGGTNLSVGQRQLVCLARAVLSHNPVLLVDEATANVDQKTDALIQQTIRKKFVSCTVLTVAHRLHTIMDSSRVMVLSHGTLRELDAPHLLLQDARSLLSELVAQTGLSTASQLKDVAETAFRTTAFSTHL